LLNVRTLILVHRDELVQQTERTLTEFWPSARLGIVKGPQNEWHGTARSGEAGDGEAGKGGAWLGEAGHGEGANGALVVIASVQSLSPKRLEQVPRDYFGLVVIDECHHVPAPTFSRAFEYFEAGFKLGVTATPDRLDGVGLSRWFGSEPVFSYGLLQAIRDKRLVPIVQYQIETNVNLDGVQRRMGDFAENQLAEAVDTRERNRAIVEAFQKHGGGRRAVVFAVNVAHAHDLAFEFSEAGFRSACVTGTMKIEERRDWLKRFAEGRVQVLVNCEILTEGFDDPNLSCIIMARPTESRAFYTQCVGRGLRLPKQNADKHDCLVLDITDNCQRHKLITACSLLGAAEHNANGRNILDVLDDEEKQEKARQEEIAEQGRNGIVKWRLKSVCPWPGLPSLEGYQPTANWHNDDASEKQLNILAGLGLKMARYPTKGEASWLIDQAMAYEEAYPAPATGLQEWFLRFRGLWQEGMTKREASKVIGKIKAGEREQGE
jgi:superfamily II DNA or RNA helicase